MLKILLKYISAMELINRAPSLERLATCVRTEMARVVGLDVFWSEEELHRIQ
jgi:hypothetical protein